MEVETVNICRQQVPVQCGRKPDLAWADHIGKCDRRRAEAGAIIVGTSIPQGEHQRFAAQRADHFGMRNYRLEHASSHPRRGRRDQADA